MRRILTFIGLELYAVLLALYQGLGSVRTDEAKYLLDIPYPHPPLMRAAMHATEALAWQEMFWRVLLATLLIQSVWLIANLAKSLSPEERLTLCGLWLFSSSILFQAGTIMMAPITALQGLLFVWILLKDSPASLRYAETPRHSSAKRNDAGWVALLWLASLFTAYQAILYGPLVLAIFMKRRVHFLHTILAIGIPIFLVTLYIAVNPLAAASFVNAGGQNVHMAFLDTVQMVLGSWLWSGSAVLSIIGVISILITPQRAFLGSFILVCAFLLVSFRAYYGILFLPLLIGGVLVYPSVLKRSSFLLALQIVVAVWIFAHTSLSFYPSPARTAMQKVNQLHTEGAVLISGSFGHEWQYESASSIYRYQPSLLSKAKAVVCLEKCHSIREYGFYPIGNTATEVWVRKK